jgi:hypothetical protein
VVENDSSRDVCEDRATVFVDGEEEVAAGVQCEAGDVLAVREWEGVGLGAVGTSAHVLIEHHVLHT